MSYLFSAFNLIASVFINKSEQDGKVVINIAPVLLLTIISVVIPCSVQDDEYFSQCLDSSAQAIREVFR